MYLHEAIRLGSTLRPKRIGYPLTDSGSTALGAAAEAIGCTPETPFEQIQERLQRTFPILRSLTGLIHDIEAFNDLSDFTRGDIAEIVENIELTAYRNHPELLPLSLVPELYTSARYRMMLWLKKWREER